MRQRLQAPSSDAQALRTELHTAATQFATLLNESEGRLDVVTSTLGGEFAAEHMNPQRIAQEFAGYPGLAELLQIATEGFTPELHNLDVSAAERRWQACGAPLAADTEMLLLTYAAEELAGGRIIVLPADEARTLQPGLVVSPVFVIDKQDGSKRQIHDLTHTYTAGKRDSVNSATCSYEYGAATIIRCVATIV